jgi:hypothetical protein
MAQMMRVGLCRPVHVKTLRSQKLRMLLTHRELLQSKAIAIENDLRGMLRNFGLKVGIVGRTKFEARIEELVEHVPDLAVLVEPLLVVRRVLREQLDLLHRRLLAVVQDDAICRRLMTVPGVGPELEKHHCRWPVEGADAEMFFCGANKLGDLPYCAQHLRAAIWTDSVTRYEVGVNHFAVASEYRE